MSPFILPGVPESSQVFLLASVGLQPLATERVAGGTRIVVPAGSDDMLLVTEDPQVVQAFRQRVAQDGPQIARLRRDLAEQRAALLADTARRLTPLGYNSDSAMRRIASVRADVQQCDALLSAGRIEQTHGQLDLIDRALDDVAVDERRLADAPQTLGSDPLAVSFDSLVEHAKFLRALKTLRGGENLLYGGDFEDLGQMVQFGWQHVADPKPGIVAGAKVSTNRPQHGSYCLELSASAASSHESAPYLSSAPVWVVSPPMPVEPGQILEITGWVRVEEQIAGSVEGLQIIDSLGGPELSLAIRQTSRWQPFQIIRGASESAELRVTFALTGLGTAHIDGVMVRELHEPVARRLPAATPEATPPTVPPPNAAPRNDTAEIRGPLFAVPQTR